MMSRLPPSPAEVIGVMLCAALASAVCVRRLVTWLEHRRIMDVPNERSLHQRATPRGGGLAILLVTAAGLFALWPMNPSWAFTRIAGAALGAALIAAVSWLDDVRGVPFPIRLATHAVAAALALATVGAVRVVELPGIGVVSLGTFAVPLSALWVIGLVSAYNFMDGIDGIAGGQAIVAGLGWAVLAAAGGQWFLMWLGALLAAASLGFEWHNWHPARIFMGDVGSTTLGYVFAVMMLAAAQRIPVLASAGVLLLWPFIFDTTFTLACRLKRREDVFAPHRGHLYQRLVQSGLSHGATTLVFVALAVLGGVTAVALAFDYPAAAALVWILTPIAGSLVWLVTSWRERSATRLV